MNIRELNEKIEEKIFSPYATLSVQSKGRRKYEKKCDIRTDFQRDRDRIIHSKAFRRLKDKTQVFISPIGDHYRTRLLHTLEVSQIARTISKALFLNEDLTEAIALGHDLGHTPFGHSGERALDKLSPNGFKHEEQSIRVVEFLENGEGLNLTYEVCDGILHHSFSDDELPLTLEGQVVRFSDKIAYINHDIDDSIRAGVITEKDLPKDLIRVLGKDYSSRVSNMIKAVVFESINKSQIEMESSTKEALLEMRKYMFQKVYINDHTLKEEKKIENIIASVYEYFKENANEMPDDFRKEINKEGINRTVCDYIAGMSDHYLLKIYEEKFIPIRNV